MGKEGWAGSVAEVSGLRRGDKGGQGREGNWDLRSLEISLGPVLYRRISHGLYGALGKGGGVLLHNQLL